MPDSFHTRLAEDTDVKQADKCGQRSRFAESFTCPALLLNSRLGFIWRGGWGVEYNDIIPYEKVLMVPLGGSVVKRREG